jgi:hypothetical protein
MTQDTTLDRTEQFVGEAGIKRLRRMSAVIVGVGGLGTHLVQQLAFLRTGGLFLVDSGRFKNSSRNRYVGSRAKDLVGTPKVELAKRLALEIDDTIRVDAIDDSLISARAYAVVQNADVVFGCVDNDGVRLVLTELCSAYDRPYFDLASEIPPKSPLQFGGRIYFSTGGQGCLHCQGLIDNVEATRFIGGEAYDQAHEHNYGVRPEALPGGGPAVVSLNGIIASLAATEYLVWATGVRPPRKHLNYRGDMGIVAAPIPKPSHECMYCQSRGNRDRAALNRYIDQRVGAYLR